MKGAGILIGNFELNPSRRPIWVWPKLLLTPKRDHVIVELQRAKCASEAPWVRKIGNPSSRENLVMTSAYEQAKRPSIRTDSGGGGGVSRDIPHSHPYGKQRNAIFPWRFFV